MIHSVEIAFLFMSFKRLRLEREQIRQILLDLEQLTSDTSFTLEKLFLKRAEQDFRVERRPYSDKIAMSLRAASQILNKTKNLLGKSKVFLSWECKQQIFVGGAVRKEIFFFFFFFFNNIYSINNQQSKILTNTTILTLLTIQYLEYNRLRYLLCLQCKDLQYSVLTTLPTHYSHYNALFTSSSN